MANEVRIVIDRLEDVTGQIIAKLAVNTTAELIERTPVDTGWARANWVPGVGAPPPSASTPTDRDSRQSAASGRAGAQQAGIASVLGYKVGRGSVFISNGVPYVVVLNEGSSTQAPAGFVQAAILAGIKSLDGARFT